MGYVITSFDIGIRHLAYCTMEYDPNRLSGDHYIVHQWDVIDLVADEAYKKNKTCQATIESGIKKGQKCGQLTHYFDSQTKVHLCKTHAKSHGDQLTRFYTPANISLYELACLAVKRLDQIDFSQSHEIIFESQPSINPKMKNFSMLLFNYFVIRYIAEKEESTRRLKEVKFISSRNKLTVYDGPYVSCNLKNQYSRNKFYGKVYCRYLLRYNAERLSFLDQYKKTDDLCDSFLQGAWYLMTMYKPSSSSAQKPRLKLKLKLKLKVTEIEDPTGPDEQPQPIGQPEPQPIGPQLLQAIKHNDVTKTVHQDVNLVKYMHLKRGKKPNPNTRHYTLSNLKYIFDHNQYNPQCTLTKRAIDFFLV
jgi:hypothetical protein